MKFGVGAFVHFSGPPHSLGWLLIVIFSAWIGQQVGGHLVNDNLGAFFGALVATPVATWVATRPSGPPSLATFLPAFWLLVPGSMGLIGVTQILAKQSAGDGTLLTAGVSIVATGGTPSAEYRSSPK